MWDEPLLCSIFKTCGFEIDLIFRRRMFNDLLFETFITLFYSVPYYFQYLIKKGGKKALNAGMKTCCEVA